MQLRGHLRGFRGSCSYDGRGQGPYDRHYAPRRNSSRREVTIRISLTCVNVLFMTNRSSIYDEQAIQQSNKNFTSKYIVNLST